ncbi:MAG: hypothetical protein ACI9DC_005361 [Gammaproteobacteria bacterium]|jgi:hypothetical protein
MKHDLLAASFLATIPSAAFSHDITSAIEPGQEPAFDITRTSATTNGRLATFVMELAGVAGSVKPVPTGQLKVAKVQS